MIPVLSGWKLWAAIAGLVVLLGLVGVVLNWKSLAERLGRARDVAEEGVKLEEQDRAGLVGELTEAEKIQKARDDERTDARRREAAFQDALRRRDSQIDALLARERSEGARVSGLRPEELEPEIKARLGLRRADDPTPGFHTEELQAIAQAVNKYPICLARLDEQDGKIADIKGEMAAVRDQLKAVDAILEQERRKNAARQAYEVKLLGHYRDAVNAIGLKRRSFKCLGLWKCGEKKLPVPRPEELAAQAPQQ